jgi:N-acetylglutamate synthase-like GNAT family acetyltransferase
MGFAIRPASETDRAAILGLMRPRDYNRINLKPTCFVVAEDAGRIIGIGQIKVHRDGTPELASLVVAADRRGQGIGRAIVQTLMSKHHGALYLTCLAELEGYYTRFGFQRVIGAARPPLLARLEQLGTIVGGLPILIGRRRLRPIVMRANCPQPIARG